MVSSFPQSGVEELLSPSPPSHLLDLPSKMADVTQAEAHCPRKRAQGPLQSSGSIPSLSWP